MERRNYFDELIVSYLSNELNAEDEAFVLDWINSSTQNKQYFEELKSAWLLLAAEQSIKNIDVEAEWRQFKLASGANQFQEAGADPNSFYQDVAEEIKLAGKSKLYSIFTSLAVAAAILIVAAVGWKSFRSQHAIEKAVTVADNKTTTSPGIHIKHLYNAGGRSKHFILEDGSKVELYGKSEIRYPEPFTNNQRLITLTGKAHFKVAKDKTKPFTVLSGDISTTALGTQFTVTALPVKKNIIVRLYEGKVVVRSSKDALKKLGEHYVLFPGDELTYDYNKLLAKVRSFRADDNLAEKINSKRDALTSDNPSLPKAGDRSWFMFNNQSLAQVFDQLSGMFKVPIEYAKKDVSNNYFIGSFNTADSLDNILKEIATLNNLKVTKKSNKIVISK